jgi:hypothetical protein
LIKLFRKDDEEAFFLTQHVRKERLVSNQVVKLLGRFRSEKIRNLRVTGAAWMLSAEGL